MNLHLHCPVATDFTTKSHGATVIFNKHLLLTSLPSTWNGMEEFTVSKCYYKILTSPKDSLEYPRIGSTWPVRRTALLSAASTELRQLHSRSETKGCMCPSNSVCSP